MPLSVARQGGAVLRGCLKEAAAAVAAAAKGAGALRVHGVGGVGVGIGGGRGRAFGAANGTGFARASSSGSGSDGGGDVDGSSVWEAHEDPPPLTPWVRQVISGRDSFEPTKSNRRRARAHRLHTHSPTRAHTSPVPSNLVGRNAGASSSGQGARAWKRASCEGAGFL